MGNEFRELETAFNQFSAFIPLAAGLATLEGRILHCNDSMCRMTGYTSDEIKGVNLNETYEHPEERVLLLERLEKIGSVRDFEVTLKRKDGTRYHASLSMTLLNLGSSKVLFTVAKDITARREMERMMSIKDWAIASSINAIALAGLEGNLTYVNPSFLKMWGYNDKDQVLGKPAIEFWQSSQKAAQVVTSLRRQDGWVGELVARKKDGSLFDVQLSASMIRDEAGSPICMMGSFLDVSDEKRAKESLEKSQTELASTLSSIDDLVLRLDKEGRFVFCHRPSHRELYMAPDKFLGKLHSEVMPRHLDHLFRQAFQENKRGKVAEYEYWLEIQGEKLWFSARLSPILLPDGEFAGSVAVIRNITQHKQEQKRLIRYQEQLRSLASELSLAEERERRRIATALHDSVGQMLAVTKLKLDALRNIPHSSELSNSLQEIRHHIEEAVQSTRSLTFDLSPPVLYELGLEAGIEWLGQHFQERHGILCDFEDDGQSKPLDETTSVLLFQASRELLLNVVKHAQSRRAKLSVAKDGQNIHVTVEDEGVGFDAERIHPTSGGPPGFGLFSIRERLEHLGGRLDVKSDPGRGTRVALIAPLKCRGAT